MVLPHIYAAGGIFSFRITTKPMNARHLRYTFHYWSIVLALFTGIHQAAAQGIRFFRITGPAATTITAFNPDGTLIWSNSQPGATYTVQTAVSLPVGTNWVDYVQIPTTNDVNTNLIVDFNPPAGMRLIPAGVFTIGDTLDGEASALPTNVTVSAFYMDVNLVTYSQWLSVYFWATNQGYTFTAPAIPTTTNRPVDSVNWFDCVKWCNARSQLAGLTPVYYTDTNFTQVYTNGNFGDYGNQLYPNWAANGYRLPTEAEWEKAARGGLSKLRFPWGDTIDWSHANYYSYWDGGVPEFSYDLAPYQGPNPAFTNQPPPYISPVGSFPSNGYGLYDMAGDVPEWCWDWFSPPPYETDSPYLGGTDPRGGGSDMTENARILRGGAYAYPANNAACAARSSATPDNSAFLSGLRCVRRH
jgi:formylglycine-generating enzyme required for sulfatase activity